MRKVIGIGETVLDIIFKDNQPIGAYPGGSSFNTLISLSRSGVPCHFISETGQDRVGENIIAFLQDSGVDTSNVHVHPEGKSPVSLAFLNEKNDAEYVFYKDHEHDKLDFTFPDIEPDDIVILGSFYAVNPVVRHQVAALLEHAREHGAIIYYDVNFRSSHQDEVMKITPNLLDNYEYADIVRGSHEDFEVLYKMQGGQKVFTSEISFYCKNFIYTQASTQVDVFSKNGFSKQYDVAEIDTVSTIGAGDNFNAGLIYGLIKYGITRQQLEAGLTEEQWDNLIACSQLFAAECCKSLLNYVSKDFGAKMKF